MGASINPSEHANMTTRTEQLKELMKTHDLTPEQVGSMLNRSAQTVRIWRCKNDSRQIPEHSLELLKAKLAQAVA